MKDQLIEFLLSVFDGIMDFLTFGHWSQQQGEVQDNWIEIK